MIHEIKIGIEAQDEQHATEIAQNLIDIKNHLSDKDLKDLAKLLKHNPAIVKTAKRLMG
jgi:hypothetical protein